MEITAEMIERRAIENQKNYMRAWREKNKDKVNAYHREWKRKFEEEHGMTYQKAYELRKAERELREEFGAM